MIIKKIDLLKKIIDDLGGEVKGQKITVLGWAFKANTNDSRESPAIYVTNKLLRQVLLLKFMTLWLKRIK